MPHTMAMPLLCHRMGWAICSPWLSPEFREQARSILGRPGCNARVSKSQSQTRNMMRCDVSAPAQAAARAALMCALFNASKSCSRFPFVACIAWPAGCERIVRQVVV